MKNITIIFLVFSLMVGSCATAQSTVKVKTVKIQTSAICGMCKTRIEKKLNYTKGIVFAELDLETKELTVKFKTKFLTAESVRKVVSDLGYHADDTKRNKDAYANLPRCCQDGGHD